MQSRLYSIQLSGINCTNCEAKIKNALAQKVKSGLIKTSVIILQEKVNVVIKNQEVLQQIQTALKQIGYRIIGDPLLIQGGGANQRTIGFLYEINVGTEQLEKIIRDTPGILSVNRCHSRDKIKLNINYDSTIIKGREIADIIEQKDPIFQTHNQRVQSFKKRKTVDTNSPSMITTGILCLFFLIFDMFLPLTGDWYMNLAIFPTQLGPYSFSVLINICVAIYTLNTYAKPIVKRSYSNYFQAGGMDMQTLISLGCLSAFFLFCFFMMKYSIDFMGDQFDDPGMSIMEINDALASSSIIVLVVTIGKHFQRKVKNKIEEMTEKIFPQSTLFTDMDITYVKLKNRKFKIQDTRDYDVSLLQKDDIFMIKGGRRLLVDSIVLSGQFQAIKSTIDGNDETQTLSKGERIESGSIIMNCSEEALLQVENVFEKSMLIEIGTHIKLGQNQRESNESGIQAVCKTVSRYFVKAVIFISLLVMASWFFLLSFNYVTVPGCNFCWIVQRGIGVLVASCPCALGLAVPSVVAIVLNIAVKNGILIKNTGVLQKMKKCKIITFDKTGTLFTRINKIEEYHIFDNEFQEKILWQIVAIIEKPIKHPIAEILYKQAINNCGIVGTNFSIFLSEHPIIRKEGLEAQIAIKNEKKQCRILIGNRKILQNKGIQVPSFQKQSSGATQLYLAIDDKACMVMVINTHSNLRPEAVKVIQLLMKNKKQVHILSGDSKESVETLGNSLNLSKNNLHPEHSSQMKMEWIKNVQRNLSEDQGIGVIMVGDGLNDIPCLQQACIGISINAKSELNINASDVVMLSEDLYKILALVKLLEKGNLFININLFWAFLYNLAIMPVVAGLFYGIDVTISPVWSSIAMSCSSVLVVSFSHILSFFEYDQSKKVNSVQNNYINLNELKSAIISPQDKTDLKFAQLQEQQA